MLRDISEWEHIGHGGNSTLPKEELRAPDKRKYLIKYPRQVEEGVAWEDITELVAAKIAFILGLESMEVEMVVRNGRQGCLLRNFVDERGPVANEEGGSLLAIFEDYDLLLKNELEGDELLKYGFNYIERLPYWESIKKSFIDMLFFDLLIGNQDRHPFNWMVLFYQDNTIQFPPIYDNGASLGFRFEDSVLSDMIKKEPKMNQYTKRTKSKVGIFEKKQVKIKVLINFLFKEYPLESQLSVEKIKSFNLQNYHDYIESLEILSKEQRDWLLSIIPFRRRKILQWIEEEGN